MGFLGLVVIAVILYFVVIKGNLFKNITSSTGSSTTGQPFPGSGTPTTSTPLPTTGGAGNDPAGIKKLFPTAAGKAPDWYMGNLNSDPRVKISGTTNDLGGGVFEGHVTSADNPASFRINVSAKGGDLTDTGEGDYNAQLAKQGADFAALAQRKYFMDPLEWRNVEMTIYWMPKTAVMDEMSLYARGGGHGHGWPISCLGNCYKCQIRIDGSSRFAKEYYHEGSAGYVFLGGSPKFSIGATQNKWIGQKAIIADIPNGVRMATYCDTEGGTDPSKQNWRLMNQLDDTGNLPGKPEIVSQCKATSPSQIFTWGGPISTFRIDVNVVDVKWCSVREIVYNPTTAAVARRMTLQDPLWQHGYARQRRQLEVPLLNISNVRR